ncbi:hypothetical protein [Kribbella swartbergensis]
MQGVGFVDDVSPDQIDALLAAARARLGELEPLKVRFPNPVIRPEAIALPPDPVEPVQEIRHTVRAAIAEVFGRTPYRTAPTAINHTSALPTSTPLSPPRPRSKRSTASPPSRPT